MGTYGSRSTSAGDARSPSSDPSVRGREDSLLSLLVEDNPGDARLLKEMLRDVPDASVRLDHVKTIAEAQKQLSEHRYDVCLVDLGLPDARDLEAVVGIREVAPQLPIVVLTGREDTDIAHRALEEGAQDYLIKGRVDGELLVRTMQYAIERNRRRIERENMSVQMAHMEHMAALGTLAAGVAHEINNPLSYIQLNLDLVLAQVADLRARYSDDEDLGEELGKAAIGLDMVKQGTDVVEGIVRDLLTFTRPSEDDVKPTSVNDAVEWAAKVARKQVSANARLMLELQPVPLALANEIRIGQVVLNLLLNSGHAFESRDTFSNIVTVRTFHRDDKVFIEVADNGVGMPESVRGRVFEPFFTTRRDKQGTGLGLFVSRNSIQHLGGEISVESQEGEGTVFRIEVPVAQSAVSTGSSTGRPAPARQRAGEPTPGRVERVRAGERPRADVRPTTSAKAPTGPPQGGQTKARPAAGTEPAEARERRRILLIDDDPLVLDVLRRVLEASYDVVAHNNPKDALDLVLNEDDAFDAVLCDLLMPELDGAGFYDAVKAAKPEFAERMIFMTGGAATPRAEQLLKRVENPCLDKPFRPREARRAIEQVGEEHQSE